MKPFTSTALALVLGALSTKAQADPASQDFYPLTPASRNAQAEAQGLIEGQSLGGTTRNWYSHEKAARETRWGYYKGDGSRHDTRRRDNWLQGTILNYSSGFSQGTVGFAAEVAAYNAIALQRSRSSVAGPNNRTLTHGDGDVVSQWSKLGLANLQARIANTTLTAGRQAVDTPMIASIGNRALPSSFQGVSLHSAEFDNLSLDLASFDRVSPRTEQSLSRFRSEYGAAGEETDRASTLGVNYQPFRSLTTSLYATKAEDFWDQYYFGATHELGDRAALGLTTTLNYYKTRDEGRGKLGAIDNDTYSLSLGLQHRAHSLTIAYQEVDGNEYFDYLHETNGIFLANSLFSDYNGPNEKSLQIAYVLDLASYGVPGLKFNLYNARGWGIDGTHYRGTGYDLGAMDGETHYEWSAGTTYVVQDGALKNSSIRATYTAHRASKGQADGNLDELRIVTTIPFSIF